jgi:Terminase large subunit, T4likevirus-type, N-terminal
MTDLRRARADLRTFSLAVEQPLTDWQAESLALDRRTTAIVAPRQSGKSRLLAVAALWWAYSRPDQRVLVVSAGEDASRRLLATAAAVAIRSPLLAGSLTDENAGLLTLSNGSEVRGVPASERAVRGWAVDLLLIDEAAQVDDDLILGAAIPTTAARPDARIVLAGSPGAAEGAFYAFAEQGEQGDEHVVTYRWALDDATWIGQQVIDSARSALAPAQFTREYEGRFADTGLHEHVIEREWIDEARRRELPPGETNEVIFGVDVARHGGDETVIVRLAGGVARVEWAVHGTDLMQIAGRLAAIARDEPWQPPSIWLDAIGLGYGVLDRLHELEVPVTPFIASARSADRARFINARSEAWWAAREAFRNGEIDLDPDDRALAAQLASVRYSLASTGAIQIASKDSMRTSPDRADALVIALHARAQAIGAGGWAELADNILARRRREAARPQARRSTEDAFGGQLPTEVAWSLGPKQEKIVPDSVIRDSAGGRHTEPTWDE